VTVTKKQIKQLSEYTDNHGMAVFQMLTWKLV